MKVSQLIKKLENFKKNNGDISVYLVDPDRLSEDGEIRGCVPLFAPWYHTETREGKPVSLLLVDPETALSFS